jgi:hypothetical protein
VKAASISNIHAGDRIVGEEWPRGRRESEEEQRIVNLRTD